MTTDPGPRNLMRALGDVRRRFGVAKPDRIFTLRGAWERPMAEQFARAHPDVRFDTALAETSNGLLFAIKMEELMRAQRELEAGQRVADPVPTLQ